MRLRLWYNLYIRGNNIVCQNLWIMQSKKFVQVFYTLLVVPHYRSFVHNTVIVNIMSTHLIKRTWSTSVVESVEMYLRMSHPEPVFQVENDPRTTWNLNLGFRFFRGYVFKIEILPRTLLLSLFDRRHLNATHWNVAAKCYIDKNEGVECEQ